MPRSTSHTRRPWRAGPPEERGGENFVLKYSGILSENFLISAQYGENKFRRTDSFVGDSFPYAVDMRWDDWVHHWSNWSRHRADDQRKAFRIDARSYLGDHEIRGGLQAEDLRSVDWTEYSGGVSYIYRDDPASSTGWSAEIRHYLEGGDFDLRSRAAWVQDEWNPHTALHFNFGLRWDEFSGDTALGQRLYSSGGQWAPRIGLSWDPHTSGLSRVYAFYGRYYQPLPKVFERTMRRSAEPKPV